MMEFTPLNSYTFFNKISGTRLKDVRVDSKDDLKERILTILKIAIRSLLYLGVNIK